jgi:hypothetical protein
MPSVSILPLGFDWLPLQEQAFAGLPQPGQILPVSVEYTIRELSVIEYIPQIQRCKKAGIHRHACILQRGCAVRYAFDLKSVTLCLIPITSFSINSYDVKLLLPMGYQL